MRAYNAGQDDWVRDHYPNYIPGALIKRAAGQRRMRHRADLEPSHSSNSK